LLNKTSECINFPQPVNQKKIQSHKATRATIKSPNQRSFVPEHKKYFYCLALLQRRSLNKRAAAINTLLAAGDAHSKRFSTPGKSHPRRVTFEIRGNEKVEKLREGGVTLCANQFHGVESAGIRGARVPENDLLFVSEMAIVKKPGSHN
jgi:hypothetical protein